MQSKLLCSCNIFLKIKLMVLQLNFIVSDKGLLDFRTLCNINDLHYYYYYYYYYNYYYYYILVTIILCFDVFHKTLGTFSIAFTANGKRQTAGSSLRFPVCRRHQN